jgi:hypothetical protein
MLDRLLHRSVVFNIDGDSYRMRAHRARAERVRKGWSSAQEDELARPVRGSSAWGLSLIGCIPSVRRFLRHDGCIVAWRPARWSRAMSSGARLDGSAREGVPGRPCRGLGAVAFGPCGQGSQMVSIHDGSAMVMRGRPPSRIRSLALGPYRVASRRS